MGNIHERCTEAEAANLASIARSICPFPEYTSNPHFNILSANSSQQLYDYQHNVSLEHGYMFNQGLKKIFGKEGKVTNGGMGVVALSLAVLFDTLARELKGECAPKSGPIPGLFLKEGDDYHPFIPVISEYVRLVPHIANNPSKTREETERCYRKLVEIKKSYWCPENREIRDTLIANNMYGIFFVQHLSFHLARLTSSNVVEMIDIIPTITPTNDSCTFEDQNVVYSFNCEPVAANKEFLTEMEKNSQAKKELRNCQPRRWITGEVINPEGTHLEHVAFRALQSEVFNSGISLENIVPEDYDLKANNMGPW